MLFEKEKRFTADDIDLTPETLEQMGEDENPEDIPADIDVDNDDGEFEIGEDLKREEAGLPEKNKPKPKEETYDKDGFNEKGFDKDGKDKDGNPQFNEDGFDKAGFDKDGKTADGRTETDFTDGFDKDGFDALGFNADGKDKDGNTAPDADISKEDTSGSEDALVLSDIVDGTKEVSIKTEDGALNLKDVLEVFKNQKDWNAKNTQNAQANARDLESLEKTQQEYEKQNLAFAETLETITGDSKFLEETDEYFGGEKKNPIRQLFETVTANKESVANRTKDSEKAEADYAKEAQRRADEELAQVIAIDSSYNALDKVQALYKVAEENGVGVLTAYNLQQVPILEDKLSTIENKNKEVLKGKDDEIVRLTNELKSRNAKITELEKNPKLEEPDETLGDVIGSDEEVGASNHKSFEEAEEAIKKKWGI